MPKFLFPELFPLLLFFYPKDFAMAKWDILWVSSSSHFPSFSAKWRGWDEGIHGNPQGSPAEQFQRSSGDGSGFPSRPKHYLRTTPMSANTGMLQEQNSRTTKRWNPWPPARWILSLWANPLLEKQRDKACGLETALGTFLPPKFQDSGGRKEILQHFRWFPSCWIRPGSHSVGIGGNFDRF